nr:hypothetical protein [Tanacetum cinerariifolium]
WPSRVTLGRLLPHARGLGLKPRRGGFPSEAKKEWGLSPKAKVRVLHTAQLDVTEGQRYNINREAAFSKVKTLVQSLNPESPTQVVSLTRELVCCGVKWRGTWGVVWEWWSGVEWGGNRLGKGGGKTGYRVNSGWCLNVGEIRHMTGNISYLSEFEPFNRGYVSFGNGRGNITGKGLIKTGKDFKLVDDKHVLLRNLRQQNMRLGHLNFKTINKLFRSNLVKGLPSKSFKLTILVLLALRESSIRLLDDTSRILRNFITEIENLKDLKVKIIKSDNVGEFRNKEMDEFYSRKGIQREFNNTRTPQHNSVVERRNRTLIETAKTMLADVKLPITFWAEAVNTSCYV